MSKPDSLPTNPVELLDFLQQGVASKNEIDPKNLKYAVYARKSTTQDERQEKSIPHQIDECMNRVIKPDSLNLVGKPLEEKCSAKDPDIRPIFRKLLSDVRDGKIDGIIAWHPDRLSRNMKEAGEIIDLLDKGVLKDLRFATSTFENSPTGKMLLGISFVLSKQYSEHLSESVTRGNRKKTENGEFFDEQKHGYYISGTRLYPDSNNFIIIKEAFQKRLEGVSQPEIAKWLNTTDYTLRRKNKAPVKYKWDKDAVSNMLRDPVYAGVLKHGDSFANLQEFYDFEPAITVKEFFKINKVKDFDSTKLVSSMMSNKRENTKADLLRGYVNCGFCNKAFSSGLTSKVLKDGPVKYYFYKCETDGCEFKGKSIRANIVLNYAFDFLSTHLFTTKSNYESFVDEARGLAIEQNKQLTSAIMSLTKVLGDKKNDYESDKRLVSQNPQMAEYYDLAKSKSDIEDMESELKELTNRKKETKGTILTYAKYLELFENISVILHEMHDMKQLDAILKKFFSNFTIKDLGKGNQQRYEITHKLKEPWYGFLKSNDFEHGRSIETLFETRPLDEILADMAIGWNVIRKEALTPVLAGAYNSDYEL